ACRSQGPHCLIEVATIDDARDKIRRRAKAECPPLGQSQLAKNHAHLADPQTSPRRPAFERPDVQIRSRRTLDETQQGRTDAFASHTVEASNVFARPTRESNPFVQRRDTLALRFAARPAFAAAPSMALSIPTVR